MLPFGETLLEGAQGSFDDVGGDLLGRGYGYESLSSDSKVSMSGVDYYGKDEDFILIRLSFLFLQRVQLRSARQQGTRGKESAE